MFELGKVNQIYEVEVGGGKFKGAPLTATRVQKLAQAHTKTTVTKGVPLKDFDAAGFSKALFLATVTAWEGVSVAGEPVECTDETKAQLYERHPDAAAEILDGFDRAVAASRDSAQKN